MFNTKSVGDVTNDYADVITSPTRHARDSSITSTDEDAGAQWPCAITV